MGNQQGGKSARPIRNRVAPSATAVSRSPVIPMDREGEGGRSPATANFWASFRALEKASPGEQEDPGGGPMVIKP